ncbi:MAG TPA: DNA glycosylase [Chthoniobacterales bacterium]|nr:DNA glycosylase [Chthoniobacterales bacterium]
MKRIEVRAAGFNLAMTLNSGQVFHWEKVDPGFYGTIGDRAVYLEQDGTILRAKVDGVALPGHRVRKKYAMTRSPTSRELAPPVSELISHYFALDHPLDEICASFPLDPVMNAARDFCQGLRIIRQPRWECLASFICSSMKQVAHIRQISRALRERFGEKKEVCGHEVFSFPLAERLAGTTENELRKCGLGYRAKNLLATAKRVVSREVSLNSWNALSDRELREQLCGLPGVGPKVANCVMLFGYERITAFPIDVWIERVLREKYFPQKAKVTRASLAEFAANYFGAHGGYAQQYLFHHARMTGKRRRKGRLPGRRSRHAACTRLVNATETAATRDDPSG